MEQPVDRTETPPLVDVSNTNDGQKPTDIREAPSYQKHDRDVPNAQTITQDEQTNLNSVQGEIKNMKAISMRRVVNPATLPPKPSDDIPTEDPNSTHPPVEGPIPAFISKALHALSGKKYQGKKF